MAWERSFGLAFGMPAGFSRAEVEAIAALAHLELDDTELDLFARQLGDILAYAEQVQQVATSGVPPTSHPFGGASEWRDDEPQPSLPREDALAQAPDADRPHGLFKVPRVIG